MIDPAAFKAFVEAELVNEHGRPVQVLPWWLDVAGGLRDNLEVAVCTIRQQGKSLLAGCLALYVLFHLRAAYVLLVAASERQAKAIAAQKFKRPIESNPRLARDARVLENRIEVPELGSVLEIVPASEATSPGRSVNLLIIDEGREVPDELYIRLKPSTLACEGRTLVTSTPGPPRGFFHELVTNPGPGTFVFRSTEVLNPYTSERHIREAAGLAHLFPGLYAREYRGEFADLGDEFISREKLERVIDPELEDRAGSELPCFAFLDLSRRRDLTSLVVLERSRVQADEAERLTCVRIRTWDPRKMPGGEIDFEVIRAALLDLFENFAMRRLDVDDRHEAAELLRWMRLRGWGGRVVPMAATAESNMKMWGVLAERIAAMTIRLPRHKRLIDELLTLRVEEMAAGRSWRVVDTRRKLHRDVSMALAGAVWAATEQRSTDCGIRVGRLPAPRKDGWSDEREGRGWPEGEGSILEPGFMGRSF